MDRGAWQATVQGATESQTEQSNQAHNTVISRSVHAAAKGMVSLFFLAE